MQLELNNNLSINENKNNLKEEQNSFLKSAFGTAVNEAIDYGLKKLLPDFIEDQVIDIKDSLLNNGIKEGINTAIDKVIDLGKSFIGIFNGDFQKVSQVEIAVQKGGLIDEMSDLFDKALENIKERDYISAKLNNIIKGGKDIVQSRLDENIKSVLKEQNKIIDNIDKCIENWNTYKTENDFEKMELEYEKIKKQAENIIPLEETLQKLQELDNLHNYIKNNNQNCSISNIELELARKL